MQHIGGMMELLQMDADQGILPWLCCLYSIWIFFNLSCFVPILITDYQTSK